MHNDTCINIELSIVGDDFDIELVSKELDIEPTEIKKKGELLPNKKNRNIETSWSFMTGLEKSLDVRTQLCKLMDIFYKKIDKLKEICLYFNTKVFVIGLLLSQAVVNTTINSIANVNINLLILFIIFLLFG